MLSGLEVVLSSPWLGPEESWFLLPQEGVGEAGS